jgi:hypothetical protein
MSTNAKIGIAVAALVALVFVVTMLSQLSKPADPDDGGGGGEEVKGGLTSPVSVMRYEPTAGRAEYRGHQQFYETGEYTVSFWVKNVHPVPFTVSFVHTSCTACSLAEFAVPPPLPFDPEDSDPSPFGAVAGGVVGQAGGQNSQGESEPPFGLNDVGYRARKRLEDAVPHDRWQRLKPPGSDREVANLKQSVEIPAAAADQPVWAVIRLNIKVTAAKKLDTVFSCQRPDSAVTVQLPLSALVAPVEPCDVYPPVIDFKTIPADENTREATVFYWSHTRSVGGSADGLLAPLPPPDVTPRVRHITFSPPVPATADELAALAARMSPPGDKDKPGPPPVRVTGAYKTTLRFSRLAAEGDKKYEADLGPFDRGVALPPDGRGLTLTKTPTVTVKANLLGKVRLVEGSKSVKDDKIDLGSFSARAEMVREVGLVSDTPGVELEAAPELTEPRYLKLDPDLKPSSDGDRTRWTLTLRMGKDVGGGEIRPGSAVVLRVKGTGQLIRIPVTGRGN